jgi:probable addiction module antidote protein
MGTLPTEETMIPITTPYDEGLMASLKDPEEATAYLNAALEDGDQEVFLLALRDVAEARGIAKLAQDAQLNRENLYRMLSRQGNPQLTSLIALLKSMGLRLTIDVEPASS